MGDLQLPNIPIKVTRQGNKLKLVAGDYTLVLKEIDGLVQTYPLLLLDKFISDVTVRLLKEEIEKAQKREAIRESLQLGPSETQATDNVIRQIHEDLFGDK